jgi:hypothetical protein
MANVQSQILEFDKAIRLGRFEENATLREKRDRVLNRLRDKFAALREEGKDVPTFKPFDQGSYRMGTGVQPADGDYDIDEGLRFECSTKDYPDPVALKVLVADALSGHTELGTDIRRSCVTVRYKVDGEQGYHVDLAVYAYDDPDGASKRLFVAKGKRDSAEENRFWEESDALGLIAWVDARFADNDDERRQFLRTIRLLKRWKTERFSLDGNAAPSGIGLTVAAGLWFRPSVTMDPLSKAKTVDDLAALRSLVDALVARFQWAGSDNSGATLYRLELPLPVAPWKDLFARMTVGQMTEFRARLVFLRDRLDAVIAEPDPVEACKLMRKEFGPEFPVPVKEDTAQIRGRAIVSPGVSA